MRNASDVAAQIEADIRALPVRNTATVRTIRRHYSQKLKTVDPKFMLELAHVLLDRPGLRWFAYELVKNHRPTFKSLDETEIEALGQGINSWDTVDGYGRTLTGPAWLNGQLSDEIIHKWAGSEDLWWRRTALVSTVALNMRSQGGHGDTARTLAVCRLLIADHEDMIVKALSWALRELVVHDPEAVNTFLQDHETKLAARVKREVRNKLKTGLKNPKKAGA